MRRGGRLEQKAQWDEQKRSDLAMCTRMYVDLHLSYSLDMRSYSSELTGKRGGQLLTGILPNDLSLGWRRATLRRPYLHRILPSPFPLSPCTLDLALCVD